MSLMIVIDGSVQQHWGPILGLCIGIYVIVEGAIAPSTACTRAAIFTIRCQRQSR